MRDARPLLLLCLCLLHAVCHAKPVVKQDDKRARVSTNAILKLESQLKDMAGEDDKPEAHKTTLKAPQTRPVDEAEDNVPPVEAIENKLKEEEESAPEGASESSPSDDETPLGVAEDAAEAAVPEVAASPDAVDQDGESAAADGQMEPPVSEEGPPSPQEGEEGPLSPQEGEEDSMSPQEEELFDRFVGMAAQHPELMDISLDDFEQLVQRLQEKEEEEELNMRAQIAARQGLLPGQPDEQEPASFPEQRMERFQMLNGDHDARVVAKKRVVPPADVLRRRAEELQQVASQAAGDVAKRQKETVNVYKKDGAEAERSKRD